MEIMTLELKYCECCGALRVRLPHSAQTYCQSCARLLEGPAIALGHGRRHRVRRPVLPVAKPATQAAGAIS